MSIFGQTDTREPWEPVKQLGHFSQNGHCRAAVARPSMPNRYSLASHSATWNLFFLAHWPSWPMYYCFSLFPRTVSSRFLFIRPDQQKHTDYRTSHRSMAIRPKVNALLWMYSSNAFYTNWRKCLYQKSIVTFETGFHSCHHLPRSRRLHKNRLKLHAFVAETIERRAIPDYQWAETELRTMGCQRPLKLIARP